MPTHDVEPITTVGLVFNRNPVAMKDLENSIDRFKNYGQLYHQKYIAPKDTQFRDVVIIGKC